MYSNLAIFADNVAVRDHPDWISQSPLGPAKMGNSNYNIYWDVVCATQPEHRAEQLDYIEDVDRHSMGVWLNSQNKERKNQLKKCLPSTHSNYLDRKVILVFSRLPQFLTNDLFR